MPIRHATAFGRLVKFLLLMQSTDEYINVPLNISTTFATLFHSLANARAGACSKRHLS